MQQTQEIVTVWTAAGIPARLLWHGERYTVSDTPTPLYGWIPDAPTHPLQPRIGWRLQGTNASGDSHIFDVHQTGRQEWELAAVYD